jgi:hypothetical protein
MSGFIKHHVIDMDESMIQRCILCGEVICDYRDVTYRLEDGPPKGFGAGNVYISKSGNPTVFKTDHWDPPPDAEKCR